METLTKATSPKKIKSKFNDEFEKYLKAQCLETKFNRLKLDTFSWYKKLLRLI